MRSIHHPSWKDIIEGVLWALGTILFVLSIMWAQSSCAQNITRKGNVFVQNSSNSNKIKKDTATLTGYFYQTSDGTKYPIYMSSTGKCFIIRTSAKTGKQYKQYLPEITKQLNGK